MTLQEVKDILDYTTTKHDAYIKIMIPLLKDFIIEHCNNEFLNDAGESVLKGGAKIALAKMIEHNMNKAGLQSRTFGQVSYSYETDFPQSILNLLEPYQRISV